MVARKNLVALFSIVGLVAVLVLWQSQRGPRPDASEVRLSNPLTLAEMCQTREQRFLLVALLDELQIDYRYYESVSDLVIRERLTKALRDAVGREVVVGVNVELLSTVSKQECSEGCEHPSHETRRVPYPQEHFEVKRLSVFVLVDLPGDEQQRLIRRFAEKATGYLEARGDIVYINNEPWSSNLRKVVEAPGSMP